MRIEDLRLQHIEPIVEHWYKRFGLVSSPEELEDTCSEVYLRCLTKAQKYGYFRLNAYVWTTLTDIWRGKGATIEGRANGHITWREGQAFKGFVAYENFGPSTITIVPLQESHLMTEINEEILMGDFEKIIHSWIDSAPPSRKDAFRFVFECKLKGFGEQKMVEVLFNQSQQDGDSLTCTQKDRICKTLNFRVKRWINQFYDFVRDMREARGGVK